MKLKYIIFYISILCIFGISVVWYQDKRINDSYPFIEFLDNPIEDRLNSIENINLKQDIEISKNKINADKASTEVSTLLAKIKQIEDELEEKLNEIE